VSRSKGAPTSGNPFSQSTRGCFGLKTIALLGESIIAPPVTHSTSIENRKSHHANQNNLFNVLAGAGVLIDVSVRYWRGTKKIKPEDLGLDQDQVTASERSAWLLTAGRAVAKNAGSSSSS
jgi:hypothetical protein